RGVTRDRSEVGLQRRGIHGDEHVRVVAWRLDVTRGEMDLERGDARGRPGRGTDLGREVRERGEVVSGDSRRVGEAAADQLHAVTRIAREADDHLLDGARLERRFGTAVGFFPRTAVVGHLRVDRYGTIASP